MTPLWRDRIESVIDADRFDLDDWHTAQAALPQLRAQDESAGADFCGHPVQDAFLEYVQKRTSIGRSACAAAHAAG